MEYLFIVCGIFAALAGYGALEITIANFGVASILFWLAMAPVSILSSGIIYMNLLPLYFLKGWNIWFLTGVFSLVFSIFISLLGWVIWASYAGKTDIDFFGVFLFVFGVHYVHRVLLLLRNESNLCFFKFKNRWLARDLELSIPVQLRGELISLRAQDQLVKITTNGGEHLLRESLTKAIERIQNIDGIKVHRSHWVAKHAIRRLVKRNGRNLVILSNGEQIPVSEKRLATVQDYIKEPSNTPSFPEQYNAQK